MDRSACEQYGQRILIIAYKKNLKNIYLFKLSDCLVLCSTGINSGVLLNQLTDNSTTDATVTGRPSNLPPIVFGIQQKVGAHDGNTDSDDCKYHEDKQHKSIDVVDLVRPERREYEVPATATHGCALLAAHHMVNILNTSLEIGCGRKICLVMFYSVSYWTLNSTKWLMTCLYTFCTASKSLTI